MLRSMMTLARWLGPWADSGRVPHVAVRDDDLSGIRVRRYVSDGSPARPRGRTFLIAPGLHYAGPDDPRMDRFCRVLAAAGHQVIAPFIPSYLALTPDAQAIADFERVFLARARWTGDAAERPIVFSISFGSLLALALAARHGDAIDRLVLFGPYADFHATMRFCLTGEVASGRVAMRDPLNQPVVLMNLLAEIEPVCADPEALRIAWRRYVERTWGRPEMKARERFTAIAEALAPEVPEAVRDLFHVGIGTRPGAADVAIAALAKFDARALDPSPYLPDVRCQVDLVHGTDDDVIPFEQTLELARRLPNADVRVHVTGLYGHTGAQRPQLSALAREMRTMIRVLRVLSG